MKEKTKERIAYLEQQIAAGNRLDGWSLEGAKQELQKLKNNGKIHLQSKIRQSS